MFYFSKKKVKSPACDMIIKFLIANQLFPSERYANKDDRAGEPESKAV